MSKLTEIQKLYLSRRNLRQALEHYAACFYAGRDCRDLSRSATCHRCKVLMDDDALFKDVNADNVHSHTEVGK